MMSGNVDFHVFEHRSNNDGSLGSEVVLKPERYEKQCN